jgi:hypothetical protein
MWNKLLVVACAAGLGACTVHRHYGASGQAQVYQGADAEPGERPLDPYGDNSAYGDDGAYDGHRDHQRSEDAYAPRSWAPDPGAAHDQRGQPCRCECHCCDRHSQLAPARPAPVVPVVPQDPADWLE